MNVPPKRECGSTRAVVAVPPPSRPPIRKNAIEATERVNPKLNAIVNEDFDFARRVARNPVAGRFVGVPTFVKDNDDLTGLPTRSGSLATPDRPAKRTSNFVRKILLPMGFIPLGKTAMPEFGLTGTTEPLREGSALRVHEMRRALAAREDC